MVTARSDPQVLDLQGTIPLKAGTAITESSFSSKVRTPSILNCKTFDVFGSKFDHSSYSKICVKYHFFRRDLVY